MSTTRSCLGTARLASAMNHIFAASGFVLQLSPWLHDVTSLPFPYISHGEDAAAPLLEEHPNPLPEPSTTPPHKTQRPEQFLLLASIVFSFCPHCRLLASPEEAQRGKGRRTEGLGTMRAPASQPFPAPTDDNRRLGSCKQPRSATLLHKGATNASRSNPTPCLHLYGFKKSVQNLAWMPLLQHKHALKKIHDRSQRGTEQAEGTCTSVTTPTALLATAIFPWEASPPV